ncbi:MAG: hypothetical protein U1F71_04370 [Verrucomicrobiaceae bacterium]
MNVAFKIGGMGAAGPVIVSMVMFVSTVLLIAPETAFWLAEQIAKPLASLFYPSDSFKKPPLSYTLARRYRNERRFDDAATQYEGIIKYYPEEKDAYLELLDVTRQMEDTGLTEKITALLCKRFPDAVSPDQVPDSGAPAPP